MIGMSYFFQETFYKLPLHIFIIWFLSFLLFVVDWLQYLHSELYTLSPSYLFLSPLLPFPICVYSLLIPGLFSFFFNPPEEPVITSKLKCKGNPFLHWFILPGREFFIDIQYWIFRYPSILNINYRFQSVIYQWWMIGSIQARLPPWGAWNIPSSMPRNRIFM